MSNVSLYHLYNRDLSNITKISAKINTMQNINILLFVLTIKQKSGRPPISPFLRCPIHGRGMVGRIMESPCGVMITWSSHCLWLTTWHPGRRCRRTRRFWWRWRWLGWCHRHHRQNHRVLQFIHQLISWRLRNGIYSANPFSKSSSTCRSISSRCARGWRRKACLIGLLLPVSIECSMRFVRPVSKVPLENILS